MIRMKKKANWNSRGGNCFYVVKIMSVSIEPVCLTDCSTVVKCNLFLISSLKMWIFSFVLWILSSPISFSFYCMWSIIQIPCNPSSEDCPKTALGSYWDAINTMQSRHLVVETFALTTKLTIFSAYQDIIFWIFTQ